MRDIPPLWRGPQLVLVACPKCRGWPFRLLPRQSVFCWKCRRWLVLAEGGHRPEVATAPPLDIWGRLARAMAELGE